MNTPTCYIIQRISLTQGTYERYKRTLCTLGRLRTILKVTSTRHIICFFLVQFNINSTFTFTIPTFHPSWQYDQTGGRIQHKFNNSWTIHCIVSRKRWVAEKKSVFSQPSRYICSYTYTIVLLSYKLWMADANAIVCQNEPTTNLGLPLCDSNSSPPSPSFTACDNKYKYKTCKTFPFISQLTFYYVYFALHMRNREEKRALELKCRMATCEHGSPSSV